MARSLPWGGPPCWLLNDGLGRVCGFRDTLSGNGVDLRSRFTILTVA